MQYLNTNRLHLKPLKESDSSFILELMNTEDWLTFIGDRKVSNQTEALHYIQKIITNNNMSYWVVQLNKIDIGIITLIKREHLSFYDIGFAFLPKFHGKGYAYEASNAIIELIIETSNYQTILATTNPKNKNSIRLIEKLGFSFYKTELNSSITSSLYRLDIDKIKIDRVIKKFYSAFTNKNTKPRLNNLYETCLDQTTIIKNTNGLCEIYSLQNFIAPREELLTNKSLEDFEEYEIDEKTIFTNHIAQRFSQYRKEGVLKKRKFSEYGTKMFQMVKINTTWNICNVIWDDDEQ